MTEQIVAFKTADGKVFEDEATAESHETRLASMRYVGKLIDSHNCPITLNSFDASDLIEYMVQNTDKFVNALSGIDPDAHDELEEDPEAESDSDPVGDAIDAREMVEALSKDLVILVEPDRHIANFDTGAVDDATRIRELSQPDDDIPF